MGTAEAATDPYNLEVQPACDIVSKAGHYFFGKDGMRPGGTYTTVITTEFLQTLPIGLRHGFFMGVLLYDYVTDAHDIHEGHQRGLDRAVYLHLAPGVAVAVVGFASRRGDEAHNEGLSQRRATTVARQIVYRSGRPFGSVRTVAVGETLSSGGAENDAHRRAVAVLLYRPPQPQLPSRPARPVTASTGHYFRIRFLDSDTHGGLAGIGSFAFEIDYDPSGINSPPSAPERYTITGAILSLGAELPGPQSNRSEWNRFQTRTARTTGSFAGAAEFGRIGFADDHADNTFTEFHLRTMQMPEQIHILWFRMPPSRVLTALFIRGPFT